MAQEKGVTYVKLDGDVGILGNGAGLVMSTLDVVALAGGRPANFLDAGGGSKADEVVARSRCSCPTPRSSRCWSTSSAASPAATRSPRACSRRSGSSARRCRSSSAWTAPTRRRAARSSRSARPPTSSSNPRCSPPPTSRRAREGGRMSILVDAEHPARGAGHHRSRGRVPRDPQQGLRHQRRRRRHARARAARTSRASRSSTPCTDAVRRRRRNTAMVFVPPRFATDALYEAIESGVELIICITEGIPAHDMLRVYTHLKRGNQTLVGPNCPGVISPGRGDASGIMPTQVFQPGRVGLVSRSGTLTYQISKELALWGSARAPSSASAATPSWAARSSTSSAGSRPTPRRTSWSWSARSAATRRRRRPSSSTPTCPPRSSATSPASRRPPASRWATREPSSPAPPGTAQAKKEALEAKRRAGGHQPHRGRPAGQGRHRRWLTQPPTTGSRSSATSARWRRPGGRSPIARRRPRHSIPATSWRGPRRTPRPSGSAPSRCGGTIGWSRSSPWPWAVRGSRRRRCATWRSAAS